MAYTPSMNRLIQELSKLPGIGEKTAARLAFHVLRADRTLAAGLADALRALKEQTRLCSTCYGLTEHDPCPICADPRARRRGHLRRRGAGGPDRDRALEGVSAAAITCCKGALSPLDGIGPEDLQIRGLLDRAARRPACAR